MTDIAPILRQVSMLLAMIPTPELEAHCHECLSSLNTAEAWGPILDPTAYRNALQTGELEDARAQLNIAKALLEARKAIAEREAFVARQQKPN